jgi:hypothetical protein
MQFGINLSLLRGSDRLESCVNCFISLDGLIMYCTKFDTQPKQNYKKYLLLLFSPHPWQMLFNIESP